MNKKKILMYYDNKESLAKKFVSSCVECSEHRIDIKMQDQSGKDI